MLNILEWNKPLKVNGKVFNNSKEAYKAFKGHTGELKIELNYKVEQEAEQPAQAKPQPTQAEPVAEDKLYKIKVKKYMTKPSTPSFDFMKKWNNDKPMPLRIMVGKKLKETRGMVKMELTGKPMPSKACMHCGRPLTNPVSMLYGLGPECGNHYYKNNICSEEELKQHMQELQQAMEDIKWTGWIIKSAIEEEELYIN